MSGSSSEPPAASSNKTLLVLTFVGPRSRPLTLAERGTHRVLVFREAPPPCFLFLDKDARATSDASVLTGTTCPAMGRCASAIEENPNNPRKQVQ
jgi:hypothetical protein